jgi:hypothetical protein
MTEEERIHRGNRAKEVLENEEFITAFDAIEQELTEAWKTSPQRDSTGREHLFLALTMLGKVKSSLTRSMETGKLAMAELQYRKSLTDKAREYLGMNTSH